MAVIKINGNEYGIKFNLRAAKVYRELTGEDITQMSGVTGIAEFVYSCIVAYHKAEKTEIKITLDDVFDGLDITAANEAVLSLMPKSTGE
jgi:hypothetical protein